MKKNASDAEIAVLITQGKSNSDVARALHVDRKRVAKVRSMANLPSESLKLPVPLDTVRAIVRLEMSQEETISEFTEQLMEYTQNYRTAIKDGDHNAAGKWAVLRLQLLDRMIQISGLQNRAARKEESAQDLLNSMTDEEVERRAREILAKRQR